MKILIAACLILFTGLSGFAQTAVQLNTQGYQSFAKGDYWVSAALFRKAAAKDENYVFAWYNLACACSRILEQPDKYIPMMGEVSCPPCDFHKFAAEGLDALRQAIKLSPDYAGKCRIDPDLKTLRTELEFYTILSFDLTRYNDVMTIIQNVGHWAMPGPGIYDPIVTLEFKADGTISIFSGMYEKTKYRIYGTWYLVQQAGKLVIKISLAENPYGLKSAVAQFNPDGTIEVDKGIWLEDWIQGGPQKYFSDYSNCCSA